MATFGEDQEIRPHLYLLKTCIKRNKYLPRLNYSFIFRLRSFFFGNVSTIAQWLLSIIGMFPNYNPHTYSLGFQLSVNSKKNRKEAWKSSSSRIFILFGTILRSHLATPPHLLRTLDLYSRSTVESNY